ncbi:hypothetical protein C9988_03125 [Pseudidiomarina aestuarii]|nr:hypothetical protein C9988_03125 [Pseudidiomarina aestuarii]
MRVDNLIELIKLPRGAENSPLSLASMLRKIQRFEFLRVVWWCFALSILAFTLARFTSAQSGVIYNTLVIAGSGSCAWFWLLSRGLFRKRKDLGPKVFSVVPVIISIEAMAALLSSAGAFGVQTEVGRVIGNAASMVCIAAIAFVWREVLHGFSKVRSEAERRFRTLYAVIFSALVAVTILWVSGANGDSVVAEWGAVVLSACAFVALGGTRFAIHYRLRNPIERVPANQPSPLDSVDPESALIAQRIMAALHNDSLLTKPNLRISEFADHIGEHEYKVTRCITNYLQYRNFNQLLNSYRIDRAKQMFKKSDSSRLSISTVAYDCGFNSLGPFNRAFKQHSGMTPREFRRLPNDPS